MTRTSTGGPGEGGAPGRRVRAASALLALASLLCSISGCNRGPARAALAEVDQALGVARPELERYVPAELARIDADATEARTRLARGRYTDALRIAQDLPGRIALAVAAADAHRNEITPVWARLAASVSPGLDAASARLAETLSSRRRPGNEGLLEAAQAELAATQNAWARAKAAYANDDIPEAIRLATLVQAKLEALSAPPKPANAASPRPAALPRPAAAAPQATEEKPEEPAPEEPPPGMEKR